MTVLLPELSPETYKSHPLHDKARAWPEVNCYVDVWIEVLASLGHDPRAAAGVSLTQDFEGDQFTFLKYLLEDLDLFYGITVQELAIYERVDVHVEEQIRRGRLPLIEVDSFYLPDTAGLAYGIEHTKTTIALNRIDIPARRIEYFHGEGYFAATGGDVEGLFHVGERLRDPAMLFPYIEFAKLGVAPPKGALPALAVARLQRHLQKVPARNPFAAFQAELPAALELMFNGADFHRYAFNTVRQFGATYALMAEHFIWLGEAGGPKADAAIAAAQRIAEHAKVLQFQLARAVARKQGKGVERNVDRLIEDYDVIMDDLHRRIGRGAGR